MGLSAGLMSCPPAVLSADFAFEAPLLDLVLGFPSFCLGCAELSWAPGWEGRLFPTASLPSLNIVAGVTRSIWLG